MLHPSTKKLIDRLIEMTGLGKLKWAEDEQGTLSYTTEGYTLSIESDPHEVLITSPEGKELERASAGDLAATMTEAGPPYTDALISMVREARRHARGTETAIHTLLAGMALDQAEPDPISPASPTPAPSSPILPRVQNEDAPLEAQLTDETTALLAEADESQKALPDTGTGSAGETIPSSPEPDMSEPANQAEIAEPAALAEPSEPACAQDEADISPEADMPDVTAAVVRLVEEVNGRCEASQSASEPATSEPATREPAADEPSGDSAENRAEGLSDPDMAADDPAGQETEADHPATTHDELSEHTDTQEYLTETAPDAFASEPVSEPIQDSDAPPKPSPVPYIPFGLDAAPTDTLQAEPTHSETKRRQTVADLTGYPALSSPTVSDMQAIGKELTEPAEATETEGLELKNLRTGFGFTPLAASDEPVDPANKVSASQTAEAEKIIIDAVDEVADSDIPGFVSGPSETTGLTYPEEEEAIEGQPRAEAKTMQTSAHESAPPNEAEDIAPLTPRTRFNPWD